MLDNILNSKFITYVLIGISLVLIILIITLSIALCSVKRRNKKLREEKKVKRARKVKTREIIKQNSAIINGQYPLVDYYEKSRGLEEEDNKSNVNCNSFNSPILKKQNLDISFIELDQSIINSKDYSLQSLFIDINEVNTNESKYKSIGSPVIPSNYSEINDSRINKSNLENKNIESSDKINNTILSVITTSIPGNNTLGSDDIRNIPPIHDFDNLQENSYHSIKNYANSSQQLPISMKYLKSLDTQNILDIQQQDIEINSHNFQINSSFESLNALDQKSNNNNDINDISNSFIHNVIPKTSNNLIYKTPIVSSIDDKNSISVHNLSRRNSTSCAENETKINKSGNSIGNTSFDETLAQNDHANKMPGRTVSYDDYTIYHNRSVNSKISSSMDHGLIIRSASNNSSNILRRASINGSNILRRASNNSSNLLRRASINGSNVLRSASNKKSNILRRTSNNSSNILKRASNNSSNILKRASNNSSNILKRASNISANTVNTSINKNIHPTINKSRVSLLSHEEETSSSVFTESASVVSLENIVPNVRRSLKMNHLNDRPPEIQKVEINLSIDDIPEDIDINNEVEEDVFMRSSMMRFVEVEPTPDIQQEAQSIHLSFVSNQSSLNILDNISNISSNNGKNTLDEENEEKKLSSEKIIIKIDDIEKNSNDCSPGELLKNTIDIVEEGQTLDDKQIPTDNLKIEN